MKKAVSIVLSVSMLAALLAGCGSKDPQPTTVPTQAVTEAPTLAPTEDTTATEGTGSTEGTVAAPVTGPSADALTILDTIWADYPEDEKFPVTGGDMENSIMGAPGALPMEKADSLTYTLLIPQDKLAQLDGAATMIHMMNANLFTGGVIHMTEGADLTAFAAEMKDTIVNNPFVCGFPERILIALVEQEYLLISYGNQELLDLFQEHLSAVYPEAQILHTDSMI